MLLIRGVVGSAGVIAKESGAAIPLKPWRLDGDQIEDALVEIKTPVSKQHARYLGQVLKPFGLVELRCFRDAETAEFVFLSLESPDSFGKPIQDDELRAMARSAEAEAKNAPSALAAEVADGKPASMPNWKPRPSRTSLPTVQIPDSAQVGPFFLAGAGQMNPFYQRRSTGEVYVSDFVSGPVAQRVFDFEVRVKLVEQPSAEEETLMDIALRNFAAVGPALRDSITPHLLRYYHAVRDQYGDADCVEYGIPLALAEQDVWDHVSLTRPAELVTSIGACDLASVHPNSAYLVFEGECAWEEEHGLQLTILNGETIVKAGPFDGHLTNYSKADPSRIDQVFWQ